MPYLPADPPLTARDLFGITRRRDAAGSGWPPPSSVFYESGRAALWRALWSSGIGPGDEVLLPSYLCESVVSPVVARGATPSFYPVGRNLRPDLAALDAAVTPSTRAVVVIHYLGFPGPVEEMRRLCDRRGLVLIEDCAHALYSRLGDRSLGTFGDFAIFSPWKSLPLPDGGLFVANAPVRSWPEPGHAAMNVDGAAQTTPAETSLPRSTTLPPSRSTTLRRLAYRSLGTLESAVGWSPRLGLLRRAGLRRGMHDRTSGAPVRLRAGSRIAREMLRSAPVDWIVAQRRDNYRRLLDAVDGLSWARPIFDGLPNGVCPLGLPLVAEARDSWRDRLLGLGVNVRTYWEHLPREVDSACFPEAAWLRDRILVLPVHQRLDTRCVDWLARQLRVFDARHRSRQLSAARLSTVAGG
jgi:perosamine synthetase